MCFFIVSRNCCPAGGLMVALSVPDCSLYTLQHCIRLVYSRWKTNTSFFCGKRVGWNTSKDCFFVQGMNITLLLKQTRHKKSKKSSLQQFQWGSDHRFWSKLFLRSGTSSRFNWVEERTPSYDRKAWGNKDKMVREEDLLSLGIFNFLWCGKNKGIRIVHSNRNSLGIANM